ncbi:MAG TPA: HU family DNA-binding protein [Bryobacteraceae bacterium]|nr:HU family DNA-binding protein [Bryobacteraceae bacterium]
MKKSDLAKKVARQQSIETAAAADRLDRVVNQILRALKRGEEARLPGLGTISPGKVWAFQQENDTPSANHEASDHDL